MKHLITPDQIAAAAFAGAYMPADSITESDIAAATEKWIVPVTGRMLYEAMLGGRYEELARDYAAPALALFTRVMIQPRLDVCVGPAGTVAMRSASYSPASDAQSIRSHRSLLVEARTLLRRMSAHLNADTAGYPEYDPTDNILNKCTIAGNIIQRKD